MDGLEVTLTRKRIKRMNMRVKEPDGRVEVEVQGPVVDLRRFLLQIKSQPHIHVARYTIAVIEPDFDERRFSVLDTIE